MTIVNFNFIKMCVQKNKPMKGKVDVKNNVLIKNISEAKLAVDAKRSAMKFEFTYSVKYEPGVGTIDLDGEILFVADAKVVTETIDTWNKDKKLTGTFTTSLMNQILSRCNVQSVVLSRDVNLPAPIPMPKVK